MRLRKSVNAIKTVTRGCVYIKADVTS